MGGVERRDGRAPRGCSRLGGRCWLEGHDSFSFAGEHAPLARASAADQLSVSGGLSAFVSCTLLWPAQRPPSVLGPYPRSVQSWLLRRLTIQERAWRLHTGRGHAREKARMPHGLLRASSGVLDDHQYSAEAPCVNRRCRVATGRLSWPKSTSGLQLCANALLSGATLASRP